MGTPEFSCHALQALVEAGHEIACVYSQPPRPAGRGQDLSQSPVHVLAESLGIAVRTPSLLKWAENSRPLRRSRPMLPWWWPMVCCCRSPCSMRRVIGCFNIHASLLPRWRGAAPIQRAIMAGDAESGVTIMRMDEGLDTGPMLISGRARRSRQRRRRAACMMRLQVLARG